jgi:hypothetical protein
MKEQTLVKVKALRSKNSIEQDNLIETEVGLGIKKGNPEYPDLGDFVIYITEGGETGYESFYYKPQNAIYQCLHGWPACAGTKGSWRQLIVPAESMLIFYDKLFKMGVLE